MMKAKLITLAAVAVLGAGSALAQKAGDWQVGGGWLHLSPRDSSTPLTFTTPVQAEVAGSGASIDNADTLGLHATYFVTDNWAVEGLLGVPPKFELQGAGTLAPLGKLGDARQWGPTLLVKYVFGESKARFRPFAGMGVAYVWYSDVNLTAGLQGAINARLGLPPGATTTRAELDASWAPVFSIGAGYRFDAHWGVSASVSYIPVKTTARLTTSTAAGVVATSEAALKVNPVVTYVAVTYRF